MKTVQKWRSVHWERLSYRFCFRIKWGFCVMSYSDMTRQRIIWKITVFILGLQSADVQTGFRAPQWRLTVWNMLWKRMTAATICIAEVMGSVIKSGTLKRWTKKGTAWRLRLLAQIWNRDSRVIWRYVQFIPWRMMMRCILCIRLFQIKIRLLILLTTVTSILQGHLLR